MSIHNVIKQPNVAILMATYNGEKFLQQQIDSILDQQDINLTVFISDDNSSDGTLELIEANTNKHANQVHFLGQRTSSKGAADNFYHLINEVNVDEFDYFAFSDQDDIWPDIIKFHEQFKECILIMQMAIPVTSFFLMKTVACSILRNHISNLN
jgi:rhamnosyltransferase